MQDKRTVVPIEVEDVDQWLFDTVEQAGKLVRLAPVETFEAAPTINVTTAASGPA